MSYRRRKRPPRRSQPSLEHDSVLRAIAGDEDDAEQAQLGQEADLADAEKAAKEQQVWDSLRDEHYEVLEQLPLSLHRTYALIRELDQQVIDRNTQLLQTLRRYYVARMAILPSLANASPAPMDVDGSPDHDRDHSTSWSQWRLPSHGDNDTAHPTRDLLRTIAQLSEEIMAASHEKLGVARFACELIDRHSRDLERAIKEQETSLSVGLRPGTHLASIILPEVVVPPAIRAPRIVHSPIPEDEDPTEDSQGRTASEAVIEHERGAPSTADEKPRKRNRSRPSRKKEDSAVPKAFSGSPYRQGSAATVLAPTEVDVFQTMELPSEDEPRFCVCNGVSAGTMIACDAKNCKYQWFHLDCLGITQVPEGDYICPYCVESSVQSAIKPIRPSRRRR